MNANIDYSAQIIDFSNCDVTDETFPDFSLYTNKYPYIILTGNKLTTLRGLKLNVAVISIDLIVNNNPYLNDLMVSEEYAGKISSLSCYNCPHIKELTLVPTYSLECYGTGIRDISGLPNTLQELNCSASQLVDATVVPASVTELSVYNDTEQLMYFIKQTNDNGIVVYPRGDCQTISNALVCIRG